MPRYMMSPREVFFCIICVITRSSFFVSYVLPKHSVRSLTLVDANTFGTVRSPCIWHFLYYKQRVFLDIVRVPSNLFQCREFVPSLLEFWLCLEHLVKWPVWLVQVPGFILLYRLCATHSKSPRIHFSFCALPHLLLWDFPFIPAYYLHLFFMTT